MVGRPGYLGDRKDEFAAQWDAEYGAGNWWLAWEAPGGEAWQFDDVFWKVYVPGYVAHLLLHPEEARYLATNYAYAIDKDAVTREQAFDPHYLYNQPGRPNQFHNVALNIALEWYLGLSFCGERPIQVRGHGTEGERWNPGYIQAVRHDLIPPGYEQQGWWQRGTIEAVYQSTKVLCVRTGF